MEGDEFESCKDYKYLGTFITVDNGCSEGIKFILAAGSGYFCSF